MEKKILRLISIVLLAVCLIPIPMRLKDGGTVKYQALLYSISDVHRLALDQEDGYQDGIIVEILGRKIFSHIE